MRGAGLTDLVQFLHGIAMMFVEAAVFGLMLAVLLAAASFGDPRIGRKTMSFLRLASGLLLWVLHFHGKNAGSSSELDAVLAGVPRIDNKHALPHHFHNVRDAKEYLASRIADQAKRQGVPLNDVEYKMLFFSSSGHMREETSAAREVFDRDYDEEEYEQKIRLLVNAITAEDAAQSLQQQDLWDDALLKLSRGDHYLSVLAGPEAIAESVARPPHDRLRLVLAGIFCAAGWVIVMVLADRFLGPDWNHPFAW
jgi:hypothetical protein